MQSRIGGNWQKILWKIVSNPAIEVVAAIAVVLVSAWVVIETDKDQRNSHVPILVGK
jgi:hypothetical protein